MSYNTIRQITDAILQEDNPGPLYRYVHQLHDIYASVTGIRAATLMEEGIHLSQGKAIGPVGAAHCLLEFRRTAVFLKGIYKAILQLQQSFPGKRINILYAGCGPYATLLTPVTTLFPATEVGFTLLDINETSLAAAKKLYETFGLEEYVSQFVLADAVEYRVKETDDIHMVISEAMLNALRREPQVAIMMNLIPQLQQGAIFIPYEIAVSAWLTSWAEEMEGFIAGGKQPKRQRLGTVYTIGSEKAEMPQETIIEIPRGPGQLDQLDLFTDITVFGDEKLGAYDCSLTNPLNVCNIGAHKGKQLTFRYITGSDPRFAYSV